MDTDMLGLVASDDLWMWVLGIVAALLLGGAGWWATSVWHALADIQKALTTHAVESARMQEEHRGLVASVRSAERLASGSVRPEILERVERDIVRRLEEQRIADERLHVRLDQVHQAVTSQMAAALQTHAAATDKLAKAAAALSGRG